MMKRLAILALGFVAPASAPTPPPPPSGWVHEVLPEGAIKPAADGIHNCLASYPERERAARVEGTTSLSYRITEDGDVTAVKVAKSSGNAALDKAAVTCVKSWHYRPTVLGEKAIEIAWRNDVKWVLEAKPEFEFPAPVRVGALPPPASPPPAGTLSGDHPPPPVAAPGSIGRPHVCRHEYPADAVVERAQGTTTIGYTITIAGTIENLHIVISSGYAALDEAALTCASTWRYKPAIKDGQPIAVPWKAEVRWLMH